MKRWVLYKHKDCIDVAIILKSSYYVPEKGIYKCKIDWYNIAYWPKYYRIDSDKIVIKREQIKDWNEHG
jgi:hypothetical protein